jgi:GNAT superfamily N-acetyltransferase
LSTNDVQAHVLTAETALGRQAIEDVMQRAYAAEIGSVPAAWARALVVDGEPVSFILVDPDRWMEHPGGDLPYAFICDIATREDRRWEGHFRRLMAHIFTSLGTAGIPLVLTHGRYPLYRPFGFDVFTHHCGIFVTPDQIERGLGTADAGVGAGLLVVEDWRAIVEDLLLVTDVKAEMLSEARAALQAAARLARERDKRRILFEHPPAPSYGSRYPIHPFLETALTVVARTCGAQVCVQGADPEAGSVPDADWIKVLDAGAFLEQALRGLVPEGAPWPQGQICLETGAGVVSLESDGQRLRVHAGARPGAARVPWPAAALAQLVTGYRSVEVLGTIHDVPLPDEALELLGALFPPRWRLSRNESWTFGA